MRIGIVAAMQSEMALLREQLDIEDVQYAFGAEFNVGTLAGVPVVLVQCGIGKVQAAVCVAVLIERFGVTHVINTGSAGSLGARLDIGDIVIATDAVQHDMDVTGLGYAPGEIPAMGLVSFAADVEMRETMLRCVEEAAPEVRGYAGRIASGDQFVCSPEQKDRIVQNFGPLCTEMEGAAVAQTCFLAKVPFVVVRAISDKADGSATVDYRAFEAEASARGARVVMRFLDSFASTEGQL